MKNVVRIIDKDPVVQDLGTIVALEGERILVRTAVWEVDATRAASCLLEPREGDRVLFCGNRREGYYVLAILSRLERSASAIAVDGDLEVKVGSGRFTVAAQKGVDLLSGSDVSIVSGKVDIRAAEGNVAVERLSFTGALLRAEAAAVKLVAECVDSVLDRLSQRVKRSFRTVEESDQLRAGRIDYVAKETMSLHAANALVTAEELVKVDGEQIHVG